MSDTNDEGEGDVEIAGENNLEGERDVDDFVDAQSFSKNALKKMNAKQKFLSDRKEKRVLDRLRKKKRKREERSLLDSQGSIVESAANVSDSNQRGNFFVPDGDRILKVGSRAYREVLYEKLKVAPICVFDMSFDDLMTEKEVISMQKQISHSYGALKRSSTPFNFYLTSLSGATLRQLQKQNGLENWQVHMTPKPFSDIFTPGQPAPVLIRAPISVRGPETKVLDETSAAVTAEAAETVGQSLVVDAAPRTMPVSKVVYLLAESLTVLERVDPNAVYVVGGIVDHNRHKGTACKKASDMGMETARLPLDRFMEGGARTVITCNQVFEILLDISKYSDPTPANWIDCFKKVLPIRWKWRAQESDAPRLVEEVDASKQGEEVYASVVEEVDVSKQGEEVDASKLVEDAKKTSAGSD